MCVLALYQINMFLFKVKNRNLEGPHGRFRFSRELYIPLNTLIVYPLL